MGRAWELSSAWDVSGPSGVKAVGTTALQNIPENRCSWQPLGVVIGRGIGHDQCHGIIGIEDQGSQSGADCERELRCSSQVLFARLCRPPYGPGHGRWASTDPGISGDVSSCISNHSGAGGDPCGRNGSCRMAADPQGKTGRGFQGVSGLGSGSHLAGRCDQSIPRRVDRGRVGDFGSCRTASSFEEEGAGSRNIGWRQVKGPDDLLTRAMACWHSCSSLVNTRAPF